MNQERPNGLIEPDQEQEQDQEHDQDITIGLPYKVVLFNDDWHTFDDVINQIIKAVRCSYETARAFAFEAHVKGKSVVFNGELNECLKVSSVLEEIALHTQIIS